MTPLEEMEAAYRRLADLRDQGIEGPWTASGGIGPIFGLLDGEQEPVAEEVLPEDSELITTLHRTVDAQLALLFAGIIALQNAQKDPTVTFDYEDGLMAIMLRFARAINGTA